MGAILTTHRAGWGQVGLYNSSPGCVHCSIIMPNVVAPGVKNFTYGTLLLEYWVHLNTLPSTNLS